MTTTPPGDPDGIRALSDAEYNVLYWLAMGRTYREIAEIRHTATVTVRDQAHQIRQKTGTHTQHQTVALWWWHRVTEALKATA